MWRMIRRGRSTKQKRLWEAVERDNVMIKSPATPAGISAIEQLIGMGINVNVTLLFSETYADVARPTSPGWNSSLSEAVTWGALRECGQFFVSRIDTAADAEISAYLKQSTREREQGRPTSLLGKLAVANAKLALSTVSDPLSGPRWEALRNGGHDPTLALGEYGHQNPQYRDVQYVEELIGPETVNTMPLATLDAFRDHSRPESRLTKDLDEAKAVLLAAEQMGISMKAITDCWKKGCSCSGRFRPTACRRQSHSRKDQVFDSMTVSTGSLRRWLPRFRRPSRNGTILTEFDVSGIAIRLSGLMRASIGGSGG